MLTVGTRQQLRAALTKLKEYQRKEEHYKSLVEKYRKLVVRYFERKNIKSFTDDEGQEWQKRQPIRLLYKEDELKALLRAKGVRPDSVFQRQVVETVNEEAVSTLLKQRVITVEEFENVVIRQAYTAYIARVPQKARKNGKGTIKGQLNG